MALQDTILQEVQAGRLQPHWTTSDLLANQNLSRCHAKTTLQTYPSNVSVSLPGLNLGDGHNAMDQPVFYRVGRRGRALLFALPEDRAFEQHAGRNVEAPSVTTIRQPAGGRRNPARQDQGGGVWSVHSDPVRAFITWVVSKETQGLFRFSYNMNGNELQANSISEAAQRYSWPTRPTSPIPEQLVAHLDSFPQGANNLHDNVRLLGLLRRELRQSLEVGDSLRHLKACWATLYWGGVANGGNLSFYGLRYISDCSGAPGGLIAYHNAAHNAGGWFDPLQTNEMRLLQNVADMTAGITKIHSLLADELVIYDSRVACALAWLVERYCDGNGLNTVPVELHFSLPQERPGAGVVRNPALVRPNASPLQTIYQNPGATRATRTTVWPRDKLRASLILSEVLSRLDRRNPQSYLEYQLGLFMIGYHLGDHRV